MKGGLVVAILGLLVPVVCWAQTPLQPPEGALAFPASEAGISAWVKVDRAIRIDERLSKLFHRIEDVSGTHILGTVEVKNFVGTLYPRVYVDTQGWIIAFFKVSDPTAWIVDWQGDHNNPTPTIRTTLEVALQAVATAAGVSLPKISFYDFRYPDANHLLIMLAVLPEPTTKVMYVKLPKGYTVYAVSYYHYGVNYHSWNSWFATVFKIDGAQVMRLEGNGLRSEAKDIPPREFQVDKLYELEVTFSVAPGRDDGSAGLAFVIIYRAP